MNKMVFYLETLVWQNGTPSTPGAKLKHKSQQPKLFMPDFMKNLTINKDVEQHDTDDIDRILNLPRREVVAEVPETA